MKLYPTMCFEGKLGFLFWVDEYINHSLPDWLFSTRFCEYVDDLIIKTLNLKIEEGDCE